MSYFVVATYWEDDAYGGPEEGGWWYRTYELQDVIAGAYDEDIAWELAGDFNGSQKRGHGPRARVVELGRRQLKGEFVRYMDYGGDDLLDEHGNFLPEYTEVRWDVPVYEPEHRPYYC